MTEHHQQAQTTKPTGELIPNATGDLTDEQVADVEEALSSGCTERQAAAYARVPLREWQAYLAVRVGTEPNYLIDLLALAEGVEATAKVVLVKALKAGVADARGASGLALDVLGRRDAAWSSKATLNVVAPKPELPPEEALRLQQVFGLVEGEKALPLADGSKSEYDKENG